MATDCGATWPGFHECAPPTSAHLTPRAAPTSSCKQNTGAGSIVLDAENPTAVRATDNYTRGVQFGIRLQTYLDGQAGKAMYERSLAATVGPGKLREACQLCDFAGYVLGGYATMWGLKASIDAANTPRLLWWRGL